MSEKASNEVWTQWELIALERAMQEPIYASEGSSAIFDAAWELERRGLLTRIDKLGRTYLEINEFGQRALHKEKQRTRGKLGTSIRDTLEGLMLAAGIPLDQYDTTLLKDVEDRIEKKRNR